MLQRGERPPGCLLRVSGNPGAQRTLCPFMSELWRGWFTPGMTQDPFIPFILFLSGNLGPAAPFGHWCCLPVPLPWETLPSPLLCLKLYSSPRLRRRAQQAHIYLWYLCLSSVPSARCLQSHRHGAQWDCSSQTLGPALSRLWPSCSVYPWLPDGIRHLCLRQ